MIQKSAQMSIEKNMIDVKDGSLEIAFRVDSEKDTVWLTQKPMSELFDVTTDTIGLHIKNILKQEELVVHSVTVKSSVTASDGKKYMTNLYHLDVIISVGYRVKPKQGIKFRTWANQVLNSHLIVQN